MTIRWPFKAIGRLFHFPALFYRQSQLQNSSCQSFLVTESLESSATCLAPFNTRAFAHRVFLQQISSQASPSLNLVKCNQHLAQAVLRDGLLICQRGRWRSDNREFVRLQTDRQADVRADAPGAAFPIENVPLERDTSPLEAASQLDGGKESRLCNANAFTGGDAIKRSASATSGRLSKRSAGRPMGDVRRLVKAGRSPPAKNSTRFGRKGWQGHFRGGARCRSKPSQGPLEPKQKVPFWALPAKSTALSAPPRWRDSTRVRFFCLRSTLCDTTCRSRSTDRIIKYVSATSAWRERRMFWYAAALAWACSRAPRNERRTRPQRSIS